MVQIVVAEVALLGVLLIDAGEIVNGVIDDVVGIQSVPEVAGDLLHGDAPTLIVLTKVHVGFVGESETKENSCKEHLDGDEKVLVGSGLY